MSVHLSCCPCAPSCGARVQVEDNRIVGIVGDGLHPLSGGYSCPKGRRSDDSSTDPAGSPPPCAVPATAPTNRMTWTSRSPRSPRVSELSGDSTARTHPLSSWALSRTSQR
ncbi:hypothetical protein [Rhodococcus sp. B50]|uniref:hypothetical protein n=1 Tax=Rhodococcus sp. B50 TaxID=2682847 RepID=UPI0027DB59AF|nr:hypothetical protein [Rhodococcus sp. B50]